MPARALTSGVLMEVSESWIEKIRWSGSPGSRLVVDRLFEMPVAYQRWLAFHYELMKQVAASQTPQEQLLRLRRTSFSLVHRQALFEHVRTAGVSRADREALFAALHGSKGYDKAVLAEHTRFLESNSSLFCTDYLELFMRNDTAFGAALADYRTRYIEFFALYCGWVLAEYRGEEFCLAPVLPEIKMQLLRLQRRIMAISAGAVGRKVRGGGAGDRRRGGPRGDRRNPPAAAADKLVASWWQSSASEAPRIVEQPHPRAIVSPALRVPRVLDGPMHPFRVGH